MSGIEPPTRVEERALAERLLERVERELDRGRVGADEPGVRALPRRSRARRPAGAASRSSRSAAAPIVSASWPGARRIENSADASTLSVVLRTPGLPPMIPFTSVDGSAHVRT